MKASDLDCIVYCTCTPDHFEPGNGVFLQRELGISDIPAIDVRNQCSGFIYGLSVADAWIRTGQYARVAARGRRGPLARPRPDNPRAGYRRAVR